ncbi:MAG: hypothetical protein WB767_00170 [Nocardioides sp.]
MAKEDDELHDDVWRAIVDNYGDRPDLAADNLPAEPEAAPSAPAAAPSSWDDGYPDADWSSDRFVPPPPPPIPATTSDRLAAWAGVFGSPAILIVCLILGIDLPQFVAYLLVAGFIGGFIYLVVTMSREPREPGDDGARI